MGSDLESCLLLCILPAFAAHDVADVRHADAVGDRDVEHGLAASVQLADLDRVLRRQHRSAWNVASLKPAHDAIANDACTSQPCRNLHRHCPCAQRATNT